MADRKILPKDYLLFRGDGATPTENFVMVACLTSQSFNRARDVIDAKTKCGPDQLPGELTFSVDFEGQTIFDTDADEKVSAPDLYDDLVSAEFINWKMGPAVPVIGDVSYTFTAFVSKLDETYSQDNPGTFSGTLSIKGTPVKVKKTS